MSTPRAARRPLQMLQPERLRSIERPFGWLPCRLLSGGWLEALSGPAKLLYMLLATAADRQGLSFYSDGRIEQVLALGAAGDLSRARLELTELDLLAFDGRLYQLLSLPSHLPRPACPSGPRTTPHEPSASTVENAPSPSDKLPEDVQAILRKLIG